MTPKELQNLQVVKKRIESGDNGIIPTSNREISGIIVCEQVWELKNGKLQPSNLSTAGWIEAQINAAVEEAFDVVHNESDFDDEKEEAEARAEVRKDVESIIQERFGARETEWILPVLWKQEDAWKFEDTDEGDEADWEDAGEEDDDDFFAEEGDGDDDDLFEEADEE